MLGCLNNPFNQAIRLRMIPRGGAVIYEHLSAQLLKSTAELLLLVH